MDGQACDMQSTSKWSNIVAFNLPGNPNKATEKDPVLTLAMMEKLKKAGETWSEIIDNLLHTEIFEIPKNLSANKYSLYHDTK